MRLSVAAGSVGIAVALFGAGPSGAAEVAFEPVASGLASPVGIANARDGSGRLFIVLQVGRIVVLERNTVRGVPFLDISDKVSCCGEQGLLGLAFHPRFSENGLFYVDYTDAGGDTVVARYRVGPDPNVADAGSESVLLRIPQPFGNHNGGQLQFGPDGYLYIGTGDGGSGGDPSNNGQNLQVLLGKLLRIDVDGGEPYAIPADNPFSASPSARGEIWAYGLRNPWRFSFDRITGDLFIADVGQNAWEEIDFQARGDAGGRNYGWRIMEGNHCFNPADGCSSAGLTLPIAEYGHDQGCSVTGGYVYRGKRNAPLEGTYLFGDFCSGTVWGSTREGNAAWQTRALVDTAFAISAFGEDEDGELYLADYQSQNGALYRIVAPLVLSPPSGRYLEDQALEPTVIVNLNGVAVVSASATLDGVDVTNVFAQCIQGSTLAGGAVGFRCAGGRAGFLGAGVHNFSVSGQLSDGTVLRDSVAWEVLRSAP